MRTLTIPHGREGTKTLLSLIATSTSFLCTSHAEILVGFRTFEFLCIRYEFVTLTKIGNREFMFCYHTSQFTQVLARLIAE